MKVIRVMYQFFEEKSWENDPLYILDEGIFYISKDIFNPLKLLIFRYINKISDRYFCSSNVVYDIVDDKNISDEFPIIKNYSQFKKWRKRYLLDKIHEYYHWLETEDSSSLANYEKRKKQIFYEFELKKLCT